MHLLAPRLCPGCDVFLAHDDEECCRQCMDSMDPAPFPSEIMMALCTRFGRDELAVAAVASMYRYDVGSTARRLLHAVKYSGCTRLGVQLGRSLASILRLLPPPFDEIDLVVPVPIHPARRRERGYNQAETIAAGLVSGGAASTFVNAVRRRKHSRSQTNLDARARLGNIVGAFSPVDVDVRGCRVLLCDDVLTTGATVNACAEVLIGMGVRSVAAATVARDEPEERHEYRNFSSDDVA